MAKHHGYAPGVVGLAISGSLGFQVAGAFGVAWIGWRLPCRLVLLVGGLVQAAIVLVMAAANSSGVYIASCCAFGLFWLALQPFQVRQAVTLEPSRQLALLVTPLALIGLSLGPLLVSMAMRPGQVSDVFVGAAGLFVSSGLAFGSIWALERLALLGGKSPASPVP